MLKTCTLYLFKICAVCVLYLRMCGMYVRIYCTYVRTVYVFSVIHHLSFHRFLFIIKRPKKVSCCPCMDRGSYNVTTNDRSTSGHEEHGSDNGNNKIYTSGDTANGTFKSGTEDDETPLLTDNQTGGAFPGG